MTSRRALSSWPGSFTSCLNGSTCVLGSTRVCVSTCSRLTGSTCAISSTEVCVSTCARLIGSTVFGQCVVTPFLGGCGLGSGSSFG